MRGFVLGAAGFVAVLGFVLLALAFSGEPLGSVWTGVPVQTVNPHVHLSEAAFWCYAPHAINDVHRERVGVEGEHRCTQGEIDAYCSDMVPQGWPALGVRPGCQV